MDMYFSVSDIAREMNMNRSYIKAEIAAGRLKAQKIGNSYVITKTDFEVWRNSPKRGSRQKAEVNE